MWKRALSSSETWGQSQGERGTFSYKTKGDMMLRKLSPRPNPIEGIVIERIIELPMAKGSTHGERGFVPEDNHAQLDTTARRQLDYYRIDHSAR